MNFSVSVSADRCQFLQDQSPPGLDGRGGDAQAAHVLPLQGGLRQTAHVQAASRHRRGARTDWTSRDVGAGAVCAALAQEVVAGDDEQAWQK